MKKVKFKGSDDQTYIWELEDINTFTYSEYGRPKYIVEAGGRIEVTREVFERIEKLLIDEGLLINLLDDEEAA